MGDELRLTQVEGEAVAALGVELLSLCAAAFPGFSAGYLADRLPLLSDPALVALRDSGGAMVGFKLGYRRGADLFYSWLGGVDPAYRRQGIARRLMTAQHDWARARGYRFIETRTRTSNNAMIVLNLTSGFTIAGFEIDRDGNAVVTQRHAL